VAAVELPRDQAPAISPVEQAVATTLGNTVELSGQSADVGEAHHLMLAGHRACALPSTQEDLLKTEHRMGQRAGMSPERGEERAERSHIAAGVREMYVALRSAAANDVPETTLDEEADARTRTGDPFITSEVLYQLSYVGSRPTVAGFR
jgi:hypothetical protein